MERANKPVSQSIFFSDDWLPHAPLAAMPLMMVQEVGPTFGVSQKNGGDVKKEKKTVKGKQVYVRKEFPETWLWAEHLVK